MRRAHAAKFIHLFLQPTYDNYRPLNPQQLTTPSIYLHFSDKSELVWAALADKYAALADQMSEADIAAAGASPRERLRAQVHAYCRFALTNPGHYRLMYGIRQPALDYERLAEHPARQVSGRLRTALARCADAGYPLTLPLYQSAHTLWTGLHGLISVQHTLVAATPADGLAAIADGLVDVIVGAKPTPGHGYPPPTEVDRMIAGYVG